MVVESMQNDARHKYGTTTENHSPDSQTNSIAIVSDGDVILDVDFGNDFERGVYRVRTQSLRTASRYFAVLLSSDRFKEGDTLKARLQDLLREGLLPDQAPVDRLPRLEISLGDLFQSWHRSHPVKLLADFWCIIHGEDLLFQKQAALDYVARLAVLADRFDCLATFAEYCRRHHLPHHKSSKSENRLGEVHTRQRLLVGYILGQDRWVAASSKKLIINGSERWGTSIVNPVETGADLGSRETENGDEEEVHDDGLLWWNLPDGLEGD
ncbi:MAG: hypothetical protein M1825_002442 [Sarcosagium campestre]|nr:MAG: hypothetical protein M1825_002442 [Sarcosagium campestre]